jgi:hypothetical protein
VRNQEVKGLLFPDGHNRFFWNTFDLGSTKVIENSTEESSGFDSANSIHHLPGPALTPE